MKFVDRIDEATRLKDSLVREKSSLVVIYGRRRLGKSTLIKRVLSDTDVYFLADRSESQYQRTLLAKVIAQIFPDFDKLTYPDWELIMCDDGSTDHTYAIAEKYKNAYPEKIQLLKNPSNKGLNYTLNRCLEVAKGEYIARMDGDDV